MAQKELQNHRLFYKSPLGWLKIIATDHALKEIVFCEYKEDADKPNALARETEQQLQEYFEKKRSVFDLPLDPDGTSFQQTVWNELLHIPYGKTISYLELSRRIHNEKAIRAVGRANGQNPIPVIIPCHRVIGSDGSLVGYGGGLWRKKQLLRLEEILLQEELDF